jgi:hypothetical protein
MSEQPQEWTKHGNFGIDVGHKLLPICHTTASRDLLFDTHNAALFAEGQRVSKLILDSIQPSVAHRPFIERIEELEQQLLQAQAAIAETNRICNVHGLRVPIESIDLSALDKHDAEVRAYGWNEGREHERKCSEALRKPLVDALEWLDRRGGLGLDAHKLIADALAKVKDLTNDKKEDE